MAAGRRSNPLATAKGAKSLSEWFSPFSFSPEPTARRAISENIKFTFEVRTVSVFRTKAHQGKVLDRKE